ncbi:hypothetical protein, partial [Helicobacter pylori]|uniref:hypothetical protein n=1 Tax=Helicobacter pylori TaxID=210 RepID=UPI0035A8DEDB
FGVGKFRDLLREYLGETNRALRYLIEGYSKQCFLTKVFGRKPLSHEKCNIFNLSLQINCSKKHAT